MITEHAISNGRGLRQPTHRLISHSLQALLLEGLDGGGGDLQVHEALGLWKGGAGMGKSVTMDACGHAMLESLPTRSQEVTALKQLTVTKHFFYYRCRQNQGMRRNEDQANRHPLPHDFLA